MIAVFSESDAKRIAAVVRKVERSAPDRNAAGMKGTGARERFCSRDTPDTIGAASEGSEAADTATWSRADDGTPLDIFIQVRQAYFHAGDKIWYAYARTFSFDSCGRLYAISAETRIEIDAPEECDPGVSAGEFSSF